MAGKNKTLRWMRVFIGGYNLSGDARTLGTLENNFEAADMTGWSEGVYNFIAGSPRHVAVRGFQALLNDAAAAAFAILKDAENSARLSILFGGGTEPAIGDPAFLIGSVQMGDLAGWDGLAATISADFLPESSQYAAGVDDPLGKVLHPETSLSATTNGTSVDNGASSANGGHANLHATVSSGGTWAFKIQHSPDNAAWADLMTFTINGSAIASEQKVVTGTIDRYTRFVATRTSGSVTPVCTFARN